MYMTFARFKSRDFCLNSYFEDSDFIAGFGYQNVTDLRIYMLLFTNCFVFENGKHHRFNHSSQSIAVSESWPV